MQALTQFHVLLLSAGRLLLVSRISGQVVQEVPLSSLGSGVAPHSTALLALLRDRETSTIYLSAGEDPCRAWRCSSQSTSCVWLNGICMARCMTVTLRCMPSRGGAV